MGRWIIGLALLLSLVLCGFAQNVAEDHFAQEDFPPGFDPNEAEEVVLKPEEVGEWLGVTDRDELHAVGMCWQSEMVRCIKVCENTTLPYEILEEICASYCQADVTWMCSKLNLDYGGTKIFKFSGRWPFKRVWIFAEFGSVLFCSLSVLTHLIYLFEYRFKTKFVRAEGKQKYPFDWLWESFNVIWAFTFAMAVTFHTIDIRLTEYLDYFSAMAASLFGLYSALVRVFEIQKSSKLWMLSTPFFGFYMFHIVRMTAVHFSYSYNMRATMTIVAAHSAVWMLWSLLNYSKSRYAVWMIIGHVSLIFFSALEVFDHPPWLGYFDTHAIWHFTINIITFFWNRFYIADAINYRTKRD